MPAHKAYIPPVIDCLDRKVTSGSTGKYSDAQPVNTTPDATTDTFSADEKPVMCEDMRLLPGGQDGCSVSALLISCVRYHSKGCSLDNAAREGFSGCMKHCLDRSDRTIAQLMKKVEAYIRGHDERRIQLSLGALSSVEYLRHLGSASSICPG